MVAAAVVAVVAGLLYPAPVDAGGHSAVRSFDAELVASGGEVTVTVAARDFGPFARVSETLPEGWEYTGSSLPEAAVFMQDRTVRFVLIDELLADGAFTYTVRAPEAEGTYAFSGIIQDSGRVAADVGGESEIVVHDECLRGPVIAGAFSLALSAGGGLEDLDACARRRGVVALHALHQGEWLSYRPGAPAFASRRFRELFSEGLPAGAPLAVQGGEDAADTAALGLASLALEGVSFGTFSPGRTEYAGVAGDGVAQATVRASAAQPEAAVRIWPADADGDPATGHQAALEAGRPVVVAVTAPDGGATRLYRVWVAGAPADGDEPATDNGEPAAECLRGNIVTGLSLVVYAGGAVDSLDACARGLGVAALNALVDGRYVTYIPGAPAFINEAFRETFPHGLPPGTPLVARAEPAADCLRGVITAGFSLVLFEGGSVDQLEACARSLGIAALYTLLADGEFVPYTVDAPDIAKRAFRELFPRGLPPDTILIAAGSGEAGAPGGGN